MNTKERIQKNLSNIPGWRSKRKIVVIESDDWGSIRMSSKLSYEKLLGLGLPIDNNHYTRFDAIESNDDLKMLFEVLKRHRDINSKHPVFTAVTIVGNPDFEKIRRSNFENYYFEPFTETLKKYSSHDEVYSLYLDGINNNIFFPAFHGREHLNICRWMKKLREKNPSVINAFESQVTGIDKGINGELMPDFQAAFDIDSQNELEDLSDILVEGLDIFEKLFGYKSKYFVPTNGPFNNTLEKVLSQKNVEYINTGKKQIEPLGGGKFRTNFRFLGEQNQYGQTYITRNCFFEPSSMEHDLHKDWVNDCLKEMKIAFFWGKPAIISTHRVNYIGFLNKKNREKSLQILDELLSRMLSTWPDIEFMTSEELGDLMSGKNV